MKEKLKEISEIIQQGNVMKVTEAVESALAQEINWEDILYKGLIPGMEIIGKKFEIEEVFIPEMIMAAKAMEAAQKVLEPFMANNLDRIAKGKVILGTVKGDLHNLGKNIVNIVLKGAGYDVIDLGVDISEEKFVEVIKIEKPDILGMSALLTTTMPRLQSTIDALKEAVEKPPKVIIGGSCVTQKYADEIGADAYAVNAGAAVDKVKELLK